ncbi:hypothetical protein CTI12_AA567740 [Artemisia annua]|uniref:Transmembrane protein n=1 Tax=Artemisia annua TaxID=35608 RepID=A0A2U1KSZ3_ARTAN|nr:hypothetical protein CTI12_AA567740 [Artemisia annua]
MVVKSGGGGDVWKMRVFVCVVSSIFVTVTTAVVAFGTASGATSVATSGPTSDVAEESDAFF